MKRIIFTQTRYCRRTGTEITNEVIFDGATAPPVQENIVMETPTRPRYPQEQKR